MPELPMVARCIKLAGSYPAGVLLYRMTFWNSCKKVRRGAGFWMVNSNERWADESAATPKQLKMAMAQLKQRGLITSEIGLFRNRTHAFIQLTGKALEGLSVKAGSEPAGKSLQGPPKSSNGVLEGSSGMETVSHSLDTASEAVSNSTGEEGKGDPMKLVTMVETKAYADKVNKLLHKPDTPSYYGKVWRDALNEAGHFCPTLLWGDLKILKQIADKCHPASGEKAIQYAVANWLKFTAQAKIDDGFGYNAPKIPSMEFLLKHAVTAVKATLTPTSPMKQEVPIATSPEKEVQLPSPPVIAPPPPKQTLDEIYSDPDEE